MTAETVHVVSLDLVHSAGPAFVISTRTPKIVNLGLSYRQPRKKGAAKHIFHFLVGSLAWPQTVARIDHKQCLRIPTCFYSLTNTIVEWILKRKQHSYRQQWNSSTLGPVQNPQGLQTPVLWGCSVQQPRGLRTPNSRKSLVTK